MHSLSHTRVFRLWVFLGAVDFKQGKDIVRVTKIPLVAVWEPREGTGLDSGWSLGLGPWVVMVCGWERNPGLGTRRVEWAETGRRRDAEATLGHSGVVGGEDVVSRRPYGPAVSL